MGHATRTGPRLATLLVLQSKQLQSFDVRIKPLFARGQVRLVVVQQVAGKACQRLLIHLFSDVGVEIVYVVHLPDTDIEAGARDVYLLRINDLNLDGLCLGQSRKAHGGRVESFINRH